MAGSPKKRARREMEAIKRLEITGRAKADKRVLKMGRPSTFTQDKANRICDLIAAGVPILDSVLKGKVIDKGVASRMGIHPATIYKWKKTRPDFDDAIARAREEGTAQLCDRVQALANVALDDPGMASAVRVAFDIYKWVCEVRNPNEYSERRRIDLGVVADLGERLRKARERVVADHLGRSRARLIEHGQVEALPAPELTREAA